jgi:hypothetical protein
VTKKAFQNENIQIQQWMKPNQKMEGYIRETSGKYNKDKAPSGYQQEKAPVETVNQKQPVKKRMNL